MPLGSERGYGLCLRRERGPRRAFGEEERLWVVFMEEEGSLSTFGERKGPLSVHLFRHSSGLLGSFTSLPF